MHTDGRILTLSTMEEWLVKKMKFAKTVKLTSLIREKDNIYIYW